MFKNVTLFLVIASLLLLPSFTGGIGPDEDVSRGRVLHVGQTTTAPGGWEEQEVIVKITSGDFSGETVSTTNSLSGNPRFDIHLEEGDLVILSLKTSDGHLREANIEDFGRHPFLLVLAALFITSLIIVGKNKGSHSLAALAITILLIVKVLLPLLLQGFSPLPLISFFAVFIATITLLIISGLNFKTLSALLGIGGGLLIAGILAFFFGNLSQLTGFVSHEAPLLQFIGGRELNLEGLLYGAIVLGALGAIMDVTISIASGMEQVHLAQPRSTLGDLYGAGIAIGRDIMGTMINTLILAYVGGALPLLLLLLAEQPSLLQLVNMDLIASEIVRALAGSTGLIISIPLTSLISGIFLSYGKK